MTRTAYSPAKIQYLIKEAGWNQKQIAIEEGVSEMAVSNVIRHRRVSKRLMAAIARRINVDPEKVFADKFSRAGLRGRPKKLK